MYLYDYVPGEVSCITEDNVTNYVLTDVVLPLPGHSIELPSNEGNYDDVCVGVYSYQASEVNSGYTELFAYL